MAHHFTVNSTIQGVSIDEFKRLASDTALHEAVCRRIPGEKLEIIESKIQGDTYTLRRAYNLDVKIPDIAKKTAQRCISFEAYRYHQFRSVNFDHRIGCKFTSSSQL